MALDDQFNYDPSASGAQAVGGPDVLATLLADTTRIKKNGYLYIYLTDETKGVSVFFDNLSVTHYPGPLLEETHYYPFGLTMAGISGLALKSNYTENKFRFNKGSELQNKEFLDGSGLDIYQTQFRNYDPQLGRWFQIDPKPTEVQGLYVAMNDNPILYNDPLGDTIIFNEDATPEFIEQFYNAFAYLDAHGVGDGLMDLQRRPEYFTIVKLPVEAALNVSGDFTPTGNVIHWSPYVGELTDHGVISPAVILDHEVWHGLQYVKNPAQYNHDTDPKLGADKSYDNKEERRVITTREQKVARALGEVGKGQVTRKITRQEVALRFRTLRLHSQS